MPQVELPDCTLACLLSSASSDSSILNVPIAGQLRMTARHRQASLRLSSHQLIVRTYVDGDIKSPAQLTTGEILQYKIMPSQKISQPKPTHGHHRLAALLPSV